MAEVRVAGLLLAAGAGRRFGGPKALAELHGEPLVVRGARTLAEGACAPVYVVLGARADEVRAVLPDGVTPVVAPDWAEGMGASLRAGLGAVAGNDVDAVLVHLVDLPGIPAQAVARVRGRASADALARGTYHGVPGHPVLFGRRWWAEIAAGAHGDRGARDWLARRDDVDLVECGDLGDGTDVDTRAALTELERR